MNNQLKYLIAFFRDPKVMLLSSEIIESDSIENALKIFYEKHPTAEILYVHNKKYEIWK